METMEWNRFSLCVAGIFVATVTAGWIHGWGTLHYTNWSAFADNVPCDKIEKIDQGVKVTVPLKVGGEYYEKISDKKLIQVIDGRCSS